MPINCLIFQDDMAKMNWTLEDARKGEKGHRENARTQTVEGKGVKV